MEQSLKYIVFSVIVLQLNQSTFMKSLRWIIVLAVIYHCTVLHNNLLPNYCRNPYQSITVMQLNVESALNNHHPTTNHILRVRINCALNSNIVLFSLLCVYWIHSLLIFSVCSFVFHKWIQKSHISNEYGSNYFNWIVLTDSFHLIQFNQ